MRTPTTTPLPAPRRRDPSTRGSRRAPTRAPAAEHVDLIRFYWITDRGIQPVVYVARRRLD